VLAFIVQYVPDGFVVVSGDDRIEPIMVCSAESRFRWDSPERNFLRSYLGYAMSVWWDHMPAQTHKNWLQYRNKLHEGRNIVTYNDIGRAIYVLWETALWSQGDYYNDTCAAHNGGFNVLTGCVATAMAIKMRFHIWPPSGDSSNSYTDSWGSIRYSHSVDFGAQSYDWASMPDTVITSANSEVARIMYHCGVAVEMDYELNASGANTLDAANALNTFFGYRGTKRVDDTTIAGFESGMMTSIIGILPVQIGYWWQIGPDTYGHSVVSDGYRDDIANKWHINCGWDGSNNGWYSLTALPSLPDSLGHIYKSCPYGQPDNWTYIENGYSGTEDGRITNPYNTLTEGESSSINSGRILVKTGIYSGTGNVPVTFDNAVAIQAFAGDVTMGGNLWLMNYETIQLHGNGQLRITPAKAGE
jgi:hypothetical protein